MTSPEDYGYNRIEAIYDKDKYANSKTGYSDNKEDEARMGFPFDFKR
jgi:hypothetical protein